MNTDIDPQRHEPEPVRARILEAACGVFAARGFEGATLSLIATRAQSSIPLVVYHFKSKIGLWRAVVASFSQPFGERLGEILGHVEYSAADRLRQVIKILIDMLAERPEIHRIVMIDAYVDSDRLTWLIDTYVRGFHDDLMALIVAAKAEGALRDLDPDLLRYVILGIATLPSVAGEYRALTSRNPTAPDELARAVNFIYKLAFND
jgi:TetR/AcrR family transcriptional regulator